jgi:hypothetical protein
MPTAAKSARPLAPTQTRLISRSPVAAGVASISSAPSARTGATRTAVRCVPSPSPHAVLKTRGGTCCALVAYSPVGRPRYPSRDLKVVASALPKTVQAVNARVRPPCLVDILTPQDHSAHPSCSDSPRPSHSIPILNTIPPCDASHHWFSGHSHFHSPHSSPRLLLSRRPHCRLVAPLRANIYVFCAFLLAILLVTRVSVPQSPLCCV